MSKFGIPYMGSKDTIAASIALNFPKADNFYDLFGGGFSISHYMLVNKSENYNKIHYNEIKKDITELVKKAINGDYSYDRFKPQWVSRENFFKNLDDPYIRICWSFGNNQKDYIFGTDIEEYKRSMHQAVIFDEFNYIAKAVFEFDLWPKNVNTIRKKRYYLRQKIEWFRVKNKIPDKIKPFIKQLQDLQQLGRLVQLQQLQQLERLQQLEITSKDYREVEILPNSIVYCDIPYQGTADYGNNFSHKDFFDWAATRDFPVYISEYNVSDPRFKLVYKIDKRSMMSSYKENTKKMSEKLYWNGVTNG